MNIILEVNEVIPKFLGRSLLMGQDRNCVYPQNTATDRYIADRHYFDKLGLEAFDNIFLSSFASSKESNSYEFQMIVKL